LFSLAFLRRWLVLRAARRESSPGAQNEESMAKATLRIEYCVQ
jgi:hypothetical protein